MASKQVKVIAVITAKDGQERELEALLRSMATPSRGEPGNIHYNLWRHREKPGEFVIDEMYVDADAATVHRASPHYQHYLTRINDLATRNAMPLEAVDTI
ncbi:putative quinol monooxygenase [Luteibacter sp. E-22]|uniref:putative quinol monooxygenase n=1 Tax=Luteibacter sp. E-22 TaxID=3404050 RepID=UPI003CE68890